MADVSSVQLRHLDDVIDGRDERGAPYWTFAVHQRHLEGYSLTGVPPELAKHLGCAPDSHTHVRVVAPAGCRLLSVRWPLRSPTGATIGYVADPLQRLGVRLGERVRITIVSADGVEVAREEIVSLSTVTPADSMIIRMKSRRKVI